MPEIDPYEEVIKENSKRFNSGRDIECGYGWIKIIKEFFVELNLLDPVSIIQIFCIKEKFGFLEIQSGYLNGDFEKFHILTDKYRHLSRSICEECGEVGKLRNNGVWMSVRCPTHSK